MFTSLVFMGYREPITDTAGKGRSRGLFPGEKGIPYFAYFLLILFNITHTCGGL